SCLRICCSLPAVTCVLVFCVFFFFQAEDGIRDATVTGVQTCALPASMLRLHFGVSCPWKRRNVSATSKPLPSSVTAMSAPLAVSTISTEITLVGSHPLPCLQALPRMFFSGRSKSRIICSRGTAANRSESAILRSGKSSSRARPQTRTWASTLAARRSVRSLRGSPDRFGTSISASNSARVRLRLIIGGRAFFWAGRCVSRCPARQSRRFKPFAVRLVLHQRVAQDFCHDLFGVEISLRQLARGAAMTLVVGCDCVERFGGLLRCGETEHPFPVGQE